MKLQQPSIYFTTDWANQLGGIYRLRLVTQPVMVITDPAIFLPLIGSGDTALPKATAYKDFNELAGDLDTDGIFTLQDFNHPKYRSEHIGVKYLSSG